MAKPLLQNVDSLKTKVKNFASHFSLGSNTVPVLIIIFLVGIVLAFVVPILPHIQPHPDEHQFYLNAWSIMDGRKLHNYLHVAITEYSLAIFLSFINAVVPTGVNFPQGDPSVATYFYGRVFGLILWLLTYFVCVLLLQKGKKIIQPRIVFFTILYFGSIGLFERFIRVNSDSMAMFIFLNYLFISFLFHQRKSRPFHFFLLNLLFMFALSFTNFKALYLGFPIFALNSIIPFIWYEKREAENPRLPASYRLVVYSLAVVVGSIILWSILVPKPINARDFWFELKHSTVASIKFDFQYPMLAHKSWLVYLYDLFAFQVGITQSAAIFIFIAMAYVSGKKQLRNLLKLDILRQFDKQQLRDGNLYKSLEVILFVTLIVYYLGLSSAVIHWSRWGAPLGLLFILMISSVLERAYYVALTTTKSRSRMFVVAPLLIVLSWSVFFSLILSIKQSDYPTKSGYQLMLNDFDSFLKEKNISDVDAPKKVGWFMSSLDNRAPNFDLAKLGKKGSSDIDYLVWPQWGSGMLYSKRNTDLEQHNIKEFMKNYTNKIIWRFPSPISYYVHYTKAFAQGFLGITWLPEVEAMTEIQYGILTMKKPIEPMRLKYEVPFNGLQHYYSPKSHLFTMETLKEGALFPPCHTNPEIRMVSTGEPAPVPKDPLVIGRTAGLYCHSLGIRMVLAGHYRVKIEGLPDDPDDVQKVYSAYPIAFEPKTKTITYSFETNRITTAFGVATKEKYIPNLKFVVDYEPF